MAGWETMQIAASVSKVIGRSSTAVKCGSCNSRRFRFVPSIPFERCTMDTMFSLFIHFLQKSELPFKNTSIEKVSCIQTQWRIRPFTTLCLVCFTPRSLAELVRFPASSPIRLVSRVVGAN
jgi:hypothetical protein